MITSIYAHGPAVIEVGKFGGTPEEARHWFLSKCVEVGANVISGKDAHGKLLCNIIGLNTAAFDILDAVADIADLHGDPPDLYSFVSIDNIKAGEYIRTSEYSD